MTEKISVFNWPELATDSLCRQLATLAGATGTNIEQLRVPVGHILAHTGGVPAFHGEPGVQDLETLAMRLLHEALRHGLSELGFAIKRPGFAVQDFRLLATDRVNVNTADEIQLELLPVIGPKIAASIVDQRLTGGWFRSADDFANRIPGIGSAQMKLLAGRLSFVSPSENWKALAYNKLDLADCLTLLMNLGGGTDPAIQLVSALETVATICADSPHPASQEKRMRENVACVSKQHAADEVHALNGSAYYEMVKESIGKAIASIDVAMFHIAFPKENHPTRAILDSLAAAKQKGAIVRVLVDRDQESDPYKSEIINRPALEYLRERGIECRSDETGRLLHSKFLVLDEERVILGSHNWSAGSYFQFDDASVLIVSKEFAATVAQRFATMWEKGTG